MEHAGSKFVNYSIADDVAFIELNRPKQLNAVNGELVSDLVEALNRAQKDGPMALVLSGSGRAFCAGHDLKAGPMSQDPVAARQGIEAIQEITRILRSSDIVSIAAVHGYALGAGIEFALSCDLVIAEAETVFGFPEVAVGLSVTGGISHLLPHTIGLARAKEMMLLGDRFTADHALSLGLINHVVPDLGHLKVAQSLARRLAGLPRKSLGVAKRNLEHGASGSLASSLTLEVENAILTGGSAEAAQARGDFNSERVAP